MFIRSSSTREKRYNIMWLLQREAGSLFSSLKLIPICTYFGFIFIHRDTIDSHLKTERPRNRSGAGGITRFSPKRLLGLALYFNPAFTLPKVPYNKTEILSVGKNVKHGSGHCVRDHILNFHSY